jgi:hypothetical protein
LVYNAQCSWDGCLNGISPTTAQIPKIIVAYVPHHRSTETHWNDVITLDCGKGGIVVADPLQTRTWISKRTHPTRLILNHFPSVVLNIGTNFVVTKKTTCNRVRPCHSSTIGRCSWWNYIGCWLNGPTLK